MCNCIAMTDEKFVEIDSNSKLDVPFVFNHKGIVSIRRVLVATVKRDEHSRKKASKIFATYCPFCGEKYPDDD